MRNTSFHNIIGITVFFIFSPYSVGANKCIDLFSASPSYADIQFAEKLSHEVAGQSEKILKDTGFSSRSKRGYAILIGTMVGSAALTTYLGRNLPLELQFMSQFILQVSTLGVYVFGAPIWEPLTSVFRKWAFGISNDSLSNTGSSQQLESAWLRTQENYSLNAQMSRNVISQFIFTIKENFYQAHRAFTNNNPVYSADQVAEAAYRMRVLFKDIDPSDASVTAAINSAFTNHVSINREFIDLVWSRIEALDGDFSKLENRSYYTKVLEAWLNKSSIKSR